MIPKGIDDEPSASNPVTSEAKPSARASMLRFCTLPNNLEIAYQSKVEVAHFYEDIFEKHVYAKNGITLEEGACVFDIGTNIGLFTLYVHQNVSNVTIYGFEPAPPLFEIVSANVSRYGINAKLFNCGVSDQTRTASFTFYPNSSGMSSFYADLDEEKEALRAIMVNQLRRGMPGMEQVMKYADDLLEERFKSETFECPLVTVSEIINRHNVQRIDLIKLDVQKSEMDVLNGIKDEDWNRIRQMVIEVHDIDGRLTEITQLLNKHGFEIIAEQDDMYERSVMYNLYAFNRNFKADLSGRPVPQETIEQSALEKIQDRVRKQEQMLGRQRELMSRRRKDK